jgi:hypothetical protein
MESIQNPDTNSSSRAPRSDLDPLDNSCRTRDSVIESYIVSHNSNDPQLPRRTLTDPINITSAATTPAPSRPPSPVGRNSDDVIRRFFQLAAQAGAPSDITDNCSLFINAQLEPPITKQGLKPLDTSTIVNALKLRLDMNYIADLVYRKMDGIEQDPKLGKTGSYWKAIEVELRLYAFLPSLAIQSSFSREMDLVSARKLCKRRIPDLLKEIRDILCTLVPKRDQVEVDKTWNEHMLQEILAGCCDFRSRASGLASLLLKHIAPCRDQSVKAMERLICIGDIPSITSGLCELLSILEACKLDCANHMLRQFRNQFIDSTTNFAVKLFSRYIEKGRMDAWPTKQWFIQNKTLALRSPALVEAATRNTDLSIFVDTFVRHILPSSTALLPQPFVVDADRIQDGRGAILQHIQMRICYDEFVHCFKVYCMDGLATAKVPENLSIKFLEQLRLMVKAGGSLLSQISNISIEIARIISAFSGEADVDTDFDLAEEIEEDLEYDLNPNYEPFEQEEERVREALTLQMFQTTDGLLNASPYSIYQKLVLQTSIPASLQGLAPKVEVWRLDNDLNKISDRMSHIVLLHWNIFGRLIYLNEHVDGPGWMKDALSELDASEHIGQGLEETQNKEITAEQAQAIQLIQQTTPCTTSLAQAGLAYPVTAVETASLEGYDTRNHAATSPRGLKTGPKASKKFIRSLYSNPPNDPPS